VNGQAGYLLLGLWPLVAAAERARNHVFAGAAIAAAVLLAGIAVLGQTRAIVPAVVVSAVVMVAVLPGRRARLWALLAVGAGVAVAAPQLLDVFQSARAGRQPDSETIRGAVAGLLVIAALTGAVFGLGRWLATRAEPRMGRRSLGMASSAALAAILVTGAVVGLTAVGDPVDRVRDEVRAFKNLGAGATEDSRSRFTSGGGNRYDYWRVAGNQFRDEPLKGLGAGNFDRTYFLERETSEDIKQHTACRSRRSPSLAWSAGQGCCCSSAPSSPASCVARGPRAPARATSAWPWQAAACSSSGWCTRAWTGCTSSQGSPASPSAARRCSLRRGRETTRRPVVRGCAWQRSFSAPWWCCSALSWSAARRWPTSTDRTVRTSVATDPRGALDKAADSLSLNDESLPAYYVQAAAHARLGRYEQARASLNQAARREPHDFVTYGLLGDLAVRRGDFAQAKRDYGRAAELNPRDAGLAQLAQRPRTALQR